MEVKIESGQFQRFSLSLVFEEKLMFNLFRNKKTTLEKRYAALLEESHKLSHVNRKQSDLKMAEAEAVLKKLEALENHS